jgi:hypothetical protein
MKTRTKLLIVGGVAVAGYLYLRSRGTTSAAAPVTGTTTSSGGTGTVTGGGKTTKPAGGVVQGAKDLWNSLTSGWAPKA